MTLYHIIRDIPHYSWSQLPHTNHVEIRKIDAFTRDGCLYEVHRQMHHEHSETQSAKRHKSVPGQEFCDQPSLTCGASESEPTQEHGPQRSLCHGEEYLCDNDRVRIDHRDVKTQHDDAHTHTHSHHHTNFERFTGIVSSIPGVCSEDSVNCANHAPDPKKDLTCTRKFHLRRYHIH